MQRIAVISGKGGTGKTTVAYSLAVSLSLKGFNVGLLDVDLTGPNVTDILEKQELDVVEDCFIPTATETIKYVSLGQIASEGDPVLWSGKDIEAAAQQLLNRTDWGSLDYLVIDFPPGSGSETQALLPLMDCTLIVTIPSVLAQSNVARIVEMCRETQVPIIGLIKNMTRFVCPHCGLKSILFPEDHDFEKLGIPTITEIPLEPKVARDKIIPDFPVDTVLEAMNHPVLLKKRKKSLKRRLMEILLKKGV